jgi:hypothetical protein
MDPDKKKAQIFGKKLFQASRARAERNIVFADVVVFGAMGQTKSSTLSLFNDNGLRRWKELRRSDARVVIHFVSTVLLLLVECLHQPNVVCCRM